MPKKDKVVDYSLYILFFFLPFSSWIVSLTGFAWLSLIRDLMVGVLIIAALLSYQTKKTSSPIILPVTAFIVWAFLSMFWREASFAQWLKGFRLLVTPLLMLLSLYWLNINEKTKNVLYKIIFYASLIIISFALLELSGINIPLTTALSGTGSLDSAQMVGTLNVDRITSILAGPNALGLFLLVVFGVSLSRFNFLSKFTANTFSVICIFFLVLTYSRSAIVGLLLFLVLLLAFQIKAKYGWVWCISFGLITILLGAIISFSLYSNTKTRDYFTHDNSSSLRFEQYQRIWHQKYEIGLWGRGTGTAGPSSQNRLDGGENHWTENTYLDIFEELGLVGLLLYIGFILYILRLNYLSFNNSIESKISFLLSISFLITGLFINYYTGQIAIYLFWLMNGLALKEQSYGKNSN